MTVNVGALDRIARAVLGLVLLYLGFAVAGGLWQVLAIVAGLVMLGVAATRVCPVYSLFGIKTCAR